MPTGISSLKLKITLIMNLQINGSVLSDSEYRKFQIMEVKQEAKNCFRYRIQLPEFSSLGLAVGQHIIIR